MSVAVYSGAIWHSEQLESLIERFGAFGEQAIRWCLASTSPPSLVCDDTDWDLLRPYRPDEMLFAGQLLPRHVPEAKKALRSEYATEIARSRARSAEPENRSRCRRAWDRLARRLEPELPAHRTAWPGELLAAAAARAWLDPWFRGRAVEFVRSRLEENVVMTAERDLELRPHFAPATFWWLLDVTHGPRPPRSHAWLGEGLNELWARAQLRHRRLEEMQKRLRAIATREYLKPGWAGFWDQWLLLLLVEKRPSLRFDGSQKRLLTSLPVLRRPRFSDLSGRLGAPTTSPTLAAAAARWEEEVPQWFHTQRGPGGSHVQT